MQTTRWNLGKHVKILIMEVTALQHLIDPRQLASLREPFDESKKVLRHYCYSSGLDEWWWSDSMECFCFLRNIQDFLGDGKTPYGRRFGESFKGLIIPFGSLIECHPISPKYQTRVHQFGKKVMPGVFLGYALIARENLERRYSGGRHGRFGKVRRIRCSSSKNQREKDILIRQDR